MRDMQSRGTNGGPRIARLGLFATCGAILASAVCGCDGSKTPAGAGAAGGAAAGGPKRVDVEAETARMMARIPAEQPGQPRVFDSAIELQRAAALLMLEASTPEQISELLPGFSGYMVIVEAPQSNKARRKIVADLGAAGAFELMDAMGRGSLASDVRFVPSDQDIRVQELGPPGLIACFARMRVSLEAGDVPAFRSSLRAAVAYVRVAGFRPPDHVTYSNLRRLLFQELCALIEARNDVMIDTLVREELKKLEPRDASPAIEYARTYMLDWAALTFGDSEYAKGVRNDPMTFFPELTRLRRKAQEERERGAPDSVELGGYDENVRAINAVMDWTRQAVSREPWQLAAADKLEAVVPEARSLVIVMWTAQHAEAIVTRFVPESLCFERGLNARLAANLYRLQANAYPASLEAMNPDAATRAGWRDPHADALMRYEPYADAERVRIWSVGPNGKDENGKGDDVVVFEK